MSLKRAGCDGTVVRSSLRVQPESQDQPLTGEVQHWFGVGIDGLGEMAAFMTADELGLCVPKLMLTANGEVIVSHPNT